ncbi:NAD(P)H-hydrate dehydratase [Pseudomonas sp. HR96]|uniref:NAD(P)H-hydrate dehydratase n=1 Tax=Pseudomonas sp. HR96 TaxID=1027966 RepID=UPI002A75FD62|nr:NAD(P)H-hydrate dehydratase [Pseudomonas sp. HR96]WPP02322.1 NAD(P)H-hydrate dehydratase [Pseudomonas sp. HR96]
MPTPNHELPHALYNAAQVRSLDQQLIAGGIPGIELMSRAANAIWQALVQHWPQERSLCVMAGHGNNAGDGYLVAAVARRAGWHVEVLAVSEPGRLQGDAATAYAEAQAAGVMVSPWQADVPLQGIVLDALLGTGLAGEVRAPYTAAIEAINNSGQPVLAVDIPSGLSSDTGEILGCAVKADLTVTLIGLKFGLFTGQAADVVGTLVFDDLLADPALVGLVDSVAERLGPGHMPSLAPRPPTSHKGQYGRVLVIGGDHGTGGAALLASESSLRCGAGMVSLATRAEHAAPALTRLPEVMVAAIHSANQLMSMLEAAAVLVVGPGMGQQSWGRSLLSAAANCAKPQVWDADALNLLASGYVALPEGCVITPHPGEAARLLGISTAEVQADRASAAHRLAQQYRAVVVLKGSGSLIAAPDGRLALCDRGHPAMATGGLGDVLSGVVGALLAQHLAPYEAACLAVWLHAAAGQEAGAGGRGLAASDLIPIIRRLLEECSPCLN